MIINILGMVIGQEALFVGYLTCHPKIFAYMGKSDEVFRYLNCYLECQSSGNSNEKEGERCGLIAWEHVLLLVWRPSLVQVVVAC